MHTRALLLTSLVIAIGACSSNSPAAQGVIGPSGGQVTAGDATIVIPANALSTNTTITVTSTEVTAPTNTVTVGTPFIFGPEGTQFTVPVTVTLPFTASLLPTGKTSSDILIYTAPAGSTDYQSLATTVVDGSHVTAQTTHFSVFVAAIPANSEDIDAGHDAAIDAPAACTPVMSGTVQSCAFTATCNGHTYKAQCAGTSCVCTTDGGSAGQVGNLGQVCVGTTGGAAAFTACQFP